MNLKHYSEFQETLDKYQISPRASRVIDDLKLVLLIAPTSGGRNTIIRHLVQTGHYYYIVSDTTRPPRINDGLMEQNGKEYWFRTEEEFLADLRVGEYLEAELIHNQQVSGISIRELEAAKTKQKIAITDIELEGLHNVVQAKPDTIAIMILPPSFDEWQLRLAGRGRMRDDEQKRRFETAQKIFKDGLSQDYYHFVISENIEQSAAIIEAIVEGKPNPHQGRAPGLIQHMEERLREKLGSTF
jgi:guanylate kinase